MDIVKKLTTPIVSGAMSTTIRVIIYGGCAIFVGFIIYSAFLKPTNTQHTTVQSGGQANYYWQGAQVHNGPFSCVSLGAEKKKELK